MSSAILRPLQYHRLAAAAAAAIASRPHLSRAARNSYPRAPLSHGSFAATSYRHLWTPKASSPSHSSKELQHHLWHKSEVSSHQESSLVPESSELAVVLLGWLGAQPKHLRKYAEWYNSRGIHAVTFVLPMNDLLSLSAVHKAEQHIERLYAEIAQWLSHENGRPRSIFVHTFSNTGWFTYGELLDLLNKRETNLLSNIEGCIVDSGPAVELSPQVWAAGFATAFMKKQSYSTQPLASAPRPSVSEVFLLAVLEKFFGMLLAVPTLKERLLRVISVLSNSQPSCPQHYIYSAADRVISASYVESFMAEQIKRGYKVTSCDMKLSPHVDHFRTYPKLYCQELETFIKECLEAKSYRAEECRV